LRREKGSPVANARKFSAYANVSITPIEIYRSRDNLAVETELNATDIFVANSDIKVHLVSDNSSFLIGNVSGKTVASDEKPKYQQKPAN